MNMLNTNADLRLKGYVYFNKVDDGVYFQGQQGGFILKGESIYPLVSKIISYNDAGFSFNDISDRLPANLQAFVSNLVGQLNEHKMLVPREQGELIDSRWLQNKSVQSFFNYLQETAPNFEQDFAKWQTQQVLISGNGIALKSAVEGMVVSGITAMTVQVVDDSSTTVDDSSTTTAEISAILAEYQEQLPGFEYRITTQALNPDKHFDQTLYCFDQLTEHHAELDNDENSTVIYAGVLSGRGIVSPLSSVSQATFNDLKRQIRPAQTQVEFPRAGLSILGSIAALNVIKGFFNIDTDTISNYVYQVSALLDVNRHPLIALTPNNVQATFVAEFENPEERELAVYERVKLAMAADFDPMLGWLDESSSKEIKQVPLFHSKITASQVTQHAKRETDVISCGMDASSAGLNAIAQALNVRATALGGADQRLVVTAFDEQEWQTLAYATACAYQQHASKRFSGSKINLIRVDDEEVQLIARFLMSYGYQTDSLNLYWNAEHTSFVAQMKSIESDFVAQGIAGKPVDAIKDCVRQLYLSQQFPEHLLLLNSKPQLTLPTATSNDTDDGLMEKLSQSPSHIPANVYFEFYEQRLANAGIYSGVAHINKQGENA